jgi:hypothetical protein
MMICPKCGKEATAEFVDVGIGTGCQAGPYYCICGWVEGGCPSNECIKWKCKSYDYCKGKSIGAN